MNSRPSSSSSTPTRAEQVFTLYAAIFIAFLVIAQVISGKHFLFRGSPLSCRDAIYPITLLVTNIVTEVYGLRQAKILVMSGLFVSILVAALTWIANNVPIATTSPVDAAAFAKVFGYLPSVVVSTLVAYLIAQLLNLYLFEWLRALTKRKQLWLRSNGATLCAQLVDTVLFLAVLGVIGPVLNGHLQSQPINQPPTGLSIGLARYTFKGLITLGGTPFVYAGVQLAHRWIGSQNH